MAAALPGREQEELMSLEVEDRLGDVLLADLICAATSGFKVDTFCPDPDTSSANYAESLGTFDEQGIIGIADEILEERLIEHDERDSISY